MARAGVPCRWSRVLAQRGRSFGVTSAGGARRRAARAKAAEDGFAMSTNRWGLFDGNALSRAIPKQARNDAGAFARRELDSGARILAVVKNKVYLDEVDPKQLGWLCRPQVEERFGLRYTSDDDDDDDGVSFASASASGEEEGGVKFDLVYLGREEGGRSFFALDLTRHRPASESPAFGELRSYIKANSDLLDSGERASSVSRAGYALALSNWARGVRFCPSCGGGPMRSAQMGTRRECPSCGKKQYPRLDPVAICLVVSSDGNHALLGSPRYASGRMLTCLAGFVEQGETLEEAAAREVMEEAGVEVGQIRILGSQPWPLGRSGACELMVGCIARATSSPGTGSLEIDFDEMNSVTWVEKGVVAEKLKQAKERIQASRLPERGAGEREDRAAGLPVEGGRGDTWIVPPYAIAHHLIDYWVNGDGNGVVAEERGDLKVSRL